MKNVQILLSTYNGEKYLVELLDSLLVQDYKNFNILIRDDGSTDDTVSILKSYKNDKIKVVYGENIGVINSFFNLLLNSDPSAEYLSFCDQDDFWEKGKISRAVKLLDEEDDKLPLLYCSKLSVVNNNLELIHYSKEIRKPASLGNSLVQNIATGCTVVINNTLKQTIIKNIPSKVIMHDWWLYLVASSMGKVIYDEKSNLLYRQHDNNVVGAESNFIQKWRNRYKRFFKEDNKNSLRDQAKELLNIYSGNMGNDQILLLKTFINEPQKYIQRLKLVVSNQIYRQSKVDNLIFKILIVINKI